MQQMELKIAHSMNYRLQAAISDTMLTIKLESDDFTTKRTFETVLSGNVEKQLKNQFSDTHGIYAWLQDNSNFQVNPVSGVLTLLKRKKNFFGKQNIEKFKITLNNEEEEKYDQKMSLLSDSESFVIPSFEDAIKKLQVKEFKIIATEYSDSFKFEDRKVECIKEFDNLYTQFMIDKVIERKGIFKFQFKMVQTTDSIVMVGVVDKNKQIGQRRSYNSGNAVCYFGFTGYIWYGTGNGQYLWKKQENGFSNGDIVRTEIDWTRGVARWFVNNQMKGQVKSPILIEPDRQFVPYFEMGEKGDIIQLMQ